MFKLDYLPLRYTDEGTVGAWFACQNVRQGSVRLEGSSIHLTSGRLPQGSLILDAIMKWISKKKEDLQTQQEPAPTSGGSPAAAPPRRYACLTLVLSDGELTPRYSRWYVPSYEQALSLEAHGRRQGQVRHILQEESVEKGR